MAKLYVCCTKPCGNKFSLEIETGFFSCPKCKKVFVRIFNHKTENYEIVTRSMLDDRGQINN